MEDQVSPLHRVVTGSGLGRVALAHGFTQTMRSWEAVGKRPAPNTQHVAKCWPVNVSTS